MLLDVETIYNDSQKISELRKRTTITKHQENSWVPMAQYNSRTNTYVNAAINLQAITSYNIEHTYSYIGQEFGSYWVKLKNIGTQTSHSGIGTAISDLSMINNVVSYTFTYTIHHLDWQIVDGSYIPDYYAPLHPDNTSGVPSPMLPPVFGQETLEEDEEDDNEEETTE